MFDDSKSKLQAMVRKVVLQTFGQARHTQDSPILPDVWLEFAASPPEKRVPLILTPKTDKLPGFVARFLRERTPPEARIATIRNAIGVDLTLYETLTLVTPMTDWWSGVCGRLRPAGQLAAERVAIASGKSPEVSQEPEDASDTAPTSADFSGASFQESYSHLAETFNWGERVAAIISRGALGDFYRFVALAGFVRLCQDRGAKWTSLKKLAGKLTTRGRQAKEFKDVIESFSELVDPIAATMDAVAAAENDRLQIRGSVWSVSQNRIASQSVAASRRTIKADAAQKVFDISTKDITWAVVDGGIDARHPTFWDRTTALSEAPKGDIPVASSRVWRTYDFTLLRTLLATGELGSGLSKKKTPAWVVYNRQKYPNLQARHSVRLSDGDDIDWDLVGPLLRVPHDDDLYAPPTTEHGTHVAGIIGGNWKKEDNPEGVDLVGMAPDIRLIDIRVFDDQGVGDEFTIVSALQFLAHLNRRRDLPVVHGANLSLSLVHQVQSFACGQTPICQECDRLGSNGLVIVAAAGNRGIEDGTGDGAVFETYRSISITDPGNADGVITVGATHRSEPHTYGVSYFSSRGPSADGRRKPDLVAPGEKIVGPTPGCGVRRMDGTSMAAPHVSGAAAVLMARHRELIGKPRAIKDILCSTATDLGRERYFQGAGLVDILRALQSV